MIEKLKHNDFIVLAYPVQFSNAPFMVRDFIRRYSELWKGKKVLCVATMGLFSGDGAGCTARLLKKYGAKVVGGLHIHMPDSVCDVKLLKKPVKKNKKLVTLADKKIVKTAWKIKKGRYPHDGMYFYDQPYCRAYLSKTLVLRKNKVLLRQIKNRIRMYWLRIV